MPHTKHTNPIQTGMAKCDIYSQRNIIEPKKEGISDIGYKHETWHYAKWNKPVTRKQIPCDSTDMIPGVVKIIKIDVIMLVVKRRGKDRMES